MEQISAGKTELSAQIETEWDKAGKSGDTDNMKSPAAKYRKEIKITENSSGIKEMMRMRTLTMTLILTLALWISAAPILTGCGEGPISDSNTNSVENVRRSADGSAGAEGDISSGYILMDMVKKSVVEILGGNYWPDKQLTEAELETETGISADMYEEYLAEKQNVETDIDMMIIIKAKPEYLTEIEMLLNEYRDALMLKYKERPQELGKVAASRIEIIDDYICFVQLGADTAAAVQEGDEKVIAQCQAENERAVDMIERTIFRSLGDTEQP